MVTGSARSRPTQRASVFAGRRGEQVASPLITVIDDADPARYSHLVFACGPLHGEPVQAGVWTAASGWAAATMPCRDAIVGRLPCCNI